VPSECSTVVVAEIKVVIKSLLSVVCVFKESSESSLDGATVLLIDSLVVIFSMEFSSDSFADWVETVSSLVRGSSVSKLSPVVAETKVVTTESVVNLEKVPEICESSMSVV